MVYIADHEESCDFADGNFAYCDQCFEELLAETKPRHNCIKTLSVKAQVMKVFSDLFHYNILI